LTDIAGIVRCHVGDSHVSVSALGTLCGVPLSQRCAEWPLNRREFSLVPAARNGLGMSASSVQSTASTSPALAPCRPAVQQVGARVIIHVAEASLCDCASHPSP
jgi:hypothetical protein